MEQRALVIAIFSLLSLHCGRVRNDAAARDSGAGGASADCTTTDPCFHGFFDANTARCVTEPQLGECDDGDPCTAGDRCEAGTCRGKARDCDDGLGCTLDSCVPGLGCRHATDVTLCDDGDPCTSDLCTAQGQCKSEPLSGNVCGSMDCVARSICAKGRCVSMGVDAAGVCYPTAIDFGDAIVGMTAQRDLVLEAASGALSIESIDSEHPDVKPDAPSLPRKLSQGQSFAIPVRWTPSAEGLLDSRIQVHTDSVTWHVQVVGHALPQPNCDDDNPCTKEGFDTNSGTCVSESMPGAACDDGDPCTLADTCNAAAACQAGDWLECPTGQICKAGECKPRQCLDAAKLSPACASVAAPLGEGCFCELVYDAALPELQSRIAGILERPGYDQQMIVSSLLAQLLIEGWDLRYPHPQLDSVELLNQALERWDIGDPFSVAGVSHQLGEITGTSDVLTLLTRYEELETQANLPSLTQTLSDAGFSPTLPEYRTLGFATQTERLIRRILDTSPAQVPAIVADLKAALANRETGLSDIVRVAFNQPNP